MESDSNTHAWKPSIRFRLILFTLIGLIVPVVSGLLVTIYGFDGLYGQDPFAYFNYATIALVEEPFPPPFYWPPGYPLLILAMTYIVGTVPQAGQLVSMLAGGLTVIFTMLLAYEFDEKRTIVIPAMAGLVLAVVGQLWQSSVVVMADTSALATATIGMWALVRYKNRLMEGAPSVHLLMIASASLGYATITRWLYGLLLVIGALYLLVYWLQNRDVISSIRLHLIFAIVIVFVVVGGVILTVFFANNTYGGSFQNHLQIWSLENAFRNTFYNPDGYLTYALPNGLYYGTIPAHTFYFTPLLAVFVFPGIWVLIRNRMFSTSIILLGWIGVMVIFLIGNPWQNIRFGLSFTPPIAVLIAMGIHIIWQQIPRLRLVSALVVCLGIMWVGISGLDLTQNFIERQQLDLATARWVESQIPLDSQIITLGLTLTLQYYTPLEVHEIYSLTKTELHNLAATGQRQYLLLDVDTVETQWRDLSPAENYHWLQENFEVIPIGERNNFTLFHLVTPQ